MSENENTVTLEGIIVGDQEGHEGQLVAVQTLTPIDIFTAPGTIPALLGAVRAVATRTPLTDTSTDKARKAIAAQAFKVAKTKTHLENLGKAEAARLKALVKPLDEGRKALWDGLERLQADIRKPLTEWENRQEQHKRNLDTLRSIPTSCTLGTPSEIIAAKLAEVENLSVDFESWGDFCRDAGLIKAGVIIDLQSALDLRLKWEADQAELERLRQEEAARKEEARKEELRLEGERRAEEKRLEAERRAQAPAPPPAPPAPELTEETVTFNDIDDNPNADLTDQLPELPPPTKELAPQPPPPPPAPAPAAPAVDPDLEHRRAFNREALADLVLIIQQTVTPQGASANETIATAVLRAIVTGQIRHTSITY